MLLLPPPNYRREDHLESRLAWVYPRKTDQELQALAMDVIQNRVFLSSMVQHQRDLSMVFMVLALMDRRSIRMLDWYGISLFYEYYGDNQADRSINGYPMFFSVRYLDREDTERLEVYIKRLQAALQGALS